MTGTPRVWRPGSLKGVDGVAEAVAAKDLNNLYLTSCYFAERERYQAFCALYAVMRVVDDRVDDVLARGRPPDETRRTAIGLEAWERLVSARLSGVGPDPTDFELCSELRAPALMEAFAGAMQSFPIDERLWNNFFSAMREDLTRSRFHTYDEFVRYAEGATVAPTTVYLWLIAAERGPAGSPFRLPSGFDVYTCGRNLGLFAYIAHVLRDLAADLRTGTEGLLYLAGDDMAAHGVTEDLLRSDLAAGRASAPVRALVGDLAERATARLAEGRRRVGELQARLSADRAFILELIIRIYRETIERIAACEYDPMTGRHRLSDDEKSKIARDVAAAMSVTRA